MRGVGRKAKKNHWAAVGFYNKGKWNRGVLIVTGVGKHMHLGIVGGCGHVGVDQCTHLDIRRKAGSTGSFPETPSQMCRKSPVSPSLTLPLPCSDFPVHFRCHWIGSDLLCPLFITVQPSPLLAFASSLCHYPSSRGPYLVSLFDDKRVVRSFREF